MIQIPPQPMEPILATAFPEDRNNIYQIKWDGIRLLVCKQRGRLNIYTKNGLERKAIYPELERLVEVLPDGTVLDGEAVIFCPLTGRPDFSLVLSRARTHKKKRQLNNQPMFYMVFDLLCYKGDILTRQPWETRNNILEEMFPLYENIILTPSTEDGQKLYEEMKAKGWEGIVSKKRQSFYLPGKKHKDWFKYKTFQVNEFTLGGIYYKNGHLSSLLIGTRQEGGLAYRGKVSSGLSLKDKELLNCYLPAMSSIDSPFTKDIEEKGDIRWVKPVLNMKIEYLTHTQNGKLRHPRIIGFTRPS